METVIDLPKIDNGSPGELGPQVTDDGVGQKPRTNEQVVMRPTPLREFGNPQVFYVTEAATKEPEELGNLSTGSVEGVAGIVPTGGIDGKGQEAVGKSGGTTASEVGDFLLSAETAGPLLAG